jgi:hypothetical protein
VAAELLFSPGHLFMTARTSYNSQCSAVLA